MMMFRAALIAFLLIVSACFGPTAKAETDGSAAPPSSGAARLLAETVIPKQLFIDQNKRSFIRGFELTTESDVQVQSLFASYPGMKEAIIKAQLDNVEMLMLREHSKLVLIIARNNDETYNSDDMTKLSAFYSGSTGKKMLALEYGSIDEAQVLKALSDGEGQLSKADSDRLNQGTAGKIFLALNKVERIEAIRFSLTPAAKKLKANAPVLQEIIRNWLNNVISEVQLSSTEISIGIITEFIAEADRKAAAQEKTGNAI